MKTNICFFIFYFFITIQVYGQVTIGSGKPPREYEILRIDGNNKSGLRLSRLNHSQRDALQEKMRVSPGSSTYKDSAKGLTIYNTATNTIEFWNGSRWIALGSSVLFDNGLYDNQLGSSLIRSTTIDIKDKELALNIKNGGEFSINGENVKMTTSDFNIGTTTNVMTLSVKGNNEEFLSINQSNQVAISADKTKAINVNNGEFIISDTRVTIPIGATLQYKDGNESNDAGLSNLILTSDADGNANWTKLEPTTRTKNIAITPRANGQTFTVNNWTTITEEMKLEKGIWVIMGRYTTYSSLRSDLTTTANNSNYLSLLRINGDSSNPASNRGTVFVTAALPEKKSTGGGEPNGPYSSPNMVAYLEVDTDTEQTFTIDFYTSKPNTYKPYNSSWLGEPYFQAVKIQ